MATKVVYLSDVQTRPKVFTVFERYRHTTAHWFVECFAEFMGVFFYVYAGVGSQLGFIIGNILKIDGLGSVFQIGMAYTMGIVFALCICGSTSNHFNPAVTATMIIYKGFPPIKGLRYVVAQILGAYVACLLIYVQWHDLIAESELALASVGMLESTLFTPDGPAGAFGLYTLPGLNLGRVFLNEFVTDTFLALIIWGSFDPTNILVPPAAAPWVIAFGYGVAIWGFSTPALAANPARDLGGRLAAMTIYGKQAAGGNYSAIAALTSIPATAFGAFLYEIFFTDSARVLPAAQREFLNAHRMHAHNQTLETSDASSTEKAEDAQDEKV